MISVLLGVVRMKAAALLVGAAGVGLIGLYQNIVATVASATALGIGVTGVRQIADAEASKDAQLISAARRALFWGTAVLCLIGAGALLFGRKFISFWLFPGESISGEIAWLSLAAALSVVGISQIALLSGYRRIGDVARVNVLGSILASIAAVCALLALGERAILVFVIVTPAAVALTGWYYAARLPSAPSTPISLRRFAHQWRLMAGLGTALTASAIGQNLTQLLVRNAIQQDLGLEALGYFHAVWTISNTYVAFILQAMAADYYPRLTAVKEDHESTNTLINDQTEVALLLACPIFLVTTGFAPWILNLLYSAEFATAAPVLRWQIFGGFLKVASWPISFLLLAKATGRLYFAAEMSAITVFALASWILLPLMGLEATGVAFVAMYAVYLPFVYVAARHISKLSWSPHVVRLFASVGLLLALTNLSAIWHPFLGAAVGVLLTIGFGLLAFRRLSRLTANLVTGDRSMR